MGLHATMRAVSTMAGQMESVKGRGRRLTAGASFALVVSGSVGSGGEALTHPGLWMVARVCGVLAVVVFGASLLRRRFAREAAWAAGAFGVLALMAALGRNEAVHLSPFDFGHGVFAGVPAVVAFLLLSAGARDDALLESSGPLRAVAVVGLLGATAVVFFPLLHVAEVRFPLGLAIEALSSGTAAERLRAGAMTLAVLPVGAAWATFLSQRRVGHVLIRGAPWAVASFHLLSPWLAPTLEVAQILAGAFVAGLIGLVALVWDELSTELDGLVLAKAFPVVDALSVGVPLVLFALLKAQGMGPSNTDENIYFYMAAQLAEGRVPYIDYFFAHPPLHVLIPGLAFAVFGYSLVFAKTFAAVAGGVTGVAIWLAGREAFGRAAAFVAMVAFLFADETLKASSTMTGVNLTTMWLALGFWQFLKGRGSVAGLLFGAAASTGFYSMAFICAAFVLGACRDRPFALRLLGGFLLVWGGLNVGFWLAAGDAFIDGVYRYHGAKAFADPRMVPWSGGEKTFVGALVHNFLVFVDGKPFLRQVYDQSHLWVALPLAPLVALVAWGLERAKGTRWRRFFDPRRFWEDDPHAAAGLVFLAACALFIQYSLFREVYSFYFVLIYPSLALLLGYVVSKGVGLFWRQGVEGQRGAWAAGMVVAVLFALHVPASRRALEVYPDEVRDAGARNLYVWTPAPVWDSTSGIVRTLFWTDDRIKGSAEPGYRSYLRNKKRQFVTLSEIARFIETRTTSDDTIAGASTLAPLIALTAHRKLAAGEADTNSKRFTTGLLNAREYWDAICADGVRYVVSIEQSYFSARTMARMPGFRLVRTFYDPQLRYGGDYPIALYERGEPCGLGR